MALTQVAGGMIASGQSIASPTFTGTSTFAGGVANAYGFGVGTAVPSSGAGIAFPATQSASSDANTLDDYEEGIWTPTITFGGGSTGLTYASQHGNYTKVGNRVFISFYVAMSNKGSSTGAITLLGLPFTSVNTTDQYNSAGIWANSLTGISGAITAFNSPNTTTLSVYFLGTGSVTALTQAYCNNNSDFIINFSYSI